MAELAVLIPALDRPHRVWPVVNSFLVTCDCDVYFICDPEDTAEIAEVVRNGDRAKLRIFEGGYAAKINHGVRSTDHPLVFLGADDLEPLPGWYEAAKARLRDDVGVVGINDMLKRDRDHTTHFLMTRAYAEQPIIDGQPGPCCEEYSHWFVDDELIATAKARGAYAYAPDAEILHLHVDAGLAPDDDTYRRGRQGSRLDAHRFYRREHLWAT
jgi:hypothetical protein